MKTLATKTAFALTLFVCGSAFSMSCNDFNQLGLANNTRDVANTKATKPQIDYFKNIAADYAGRMYKFRFTERGKAYASVRDRDLVASLMQSALAISRGDCISNPSASAESIINESLNSILDAISAEMNK